MKEGLLYMAKVAECLDAKDADRYRRTIENPPARVDVMMEQVQMFLAHLRRELDRLAPLQEAEDVSQRAQTLAYADMLDAMANLQMKVYPQAQRQYGTNLGRVIFDEPIAVTKDDTVRIENGIVKIAKPGDVLKSLPPGGKDGW